MPIQSFRFTRLADLRQEGVGSLHASFILLLNIKEDDVKEGKKLNLSASLICNAARAYGSGKVVPWCKVRNNIDNKEYIFDATGKSFLLSHNKTLIGNAVFIIPRKKMSFPL